MNDFITREGAYSYLSVALLSFVLGLLAYVITDWIKRRIEKRKLISIFVDDIKKNWEQLDSLRGSPVEPYFFSRVRLYLKGIRSIPFVGQPEFEFEVYNLKFYETEGLKLVQHLGKTARKEFWEVYTLMRDADAVRLVIRSITRDHQDRSAYQKLFVALVEDLAKKLVRLASTLEAEKSLIARFLVTTGDRNRERMMKQKAT